MTNPNRTIRDALKTLVSAIDISAIDGLSWKFEKAHPMKQASDYPGFFVAPARNEPPVTLDNVTQEVPYTFWIYLVHSYEHAAEAEDQLIDISDLVFPHLMQKLKAGQIVPGVTFDGDISGIWGSEPEYGERFYRIEITAHTTKELDLAP